MGIPYTWPDNLRKPQATHRLPLLTRTQGGLGPGVFCHVIQQGVAGNEERKATWGGFLTLDTEAALEALKSEKDRETE